MNEVDVTSVAYVFMRALNRQISLCVHKMTMECVANSSPRKIVVSLWAYEFDTVVRFIKKNCIVKSGFLTFDTLCQSNKTIIECFYFQIKMEYARIFPQL